MNYLVALLALATLAACSGLERQPDTRQWTRVTCSGGSMDWSDCGRQAEQLCPNGFDIANREENRSALLRAYEVACQ